MFKKILIANRGEIAVRIIRACRELGIGTVAVYSEADASAPFVWLADDAALLGPAPSSESYLRSDKILEAAAHFDCDAIHPGYGFLAENGDFAEQVAEAGITFIGPSPETIRTMGSKTAARALMQDAGVPIVPGYPDGGTNKVPGYPDGETNKVPGYPSGMADEDLMGAADAVGYPLLVKAAAGGGGKGMRIVADATQLAGAIQSARHEAMSAFGDDQLFLERYIAEPRHIEFQIFGDSQGTIVHLFERECSIQRRHQKIIEESPSVLLDDDLRERMGNAAIAAAKATGYVNAGTVEFLADTDGNFYFLEMNTRLQVEHPITEMVTGVDLVKLQIRVAAGEPLPFAQSDLRQRGHAIECRVYAEDPANDFLPSIGHIEFIQEPTGPGLRVDSGVSSGVQVSIYYDPMLAKLIVLGDNRDDAIDKMLSALRDYVVLGDLVTNIPYLRELINHPAFRAGETTTSFIERHLPTWQLARGELPDAILIAAALADLADPTTQSSGELELHETDLHSPWQMGGSYRLGA